MKIHKRDKNRSPVKVKEDVIDTKKIYREDIYDVVQSCETREEAIEELKEWLEEIPEEAFAPTKKEAGIARVLSDIDSYKRWNEHTESKGSPRRSKAAGKKS